MPLSAVAQTNSTARVAPQLGGFAALDAPTLRRSIARLPLDTIEAALVNVMGKRENTTQLEFNGFVDRNEKTLRSSQLLVHLASRGKTEAFAAALDAAGVALPAGDLTWRLDGKMATFQPPSEPRGPWLGGVIRALGKALDGPQDLEDAVFDFGSRLNLHTGTGALNHQMFQLLDALDRKGQLEKFLAVVGTTATPEVKTQSSASTSDVAKTIGASTTEQLTPVTAREGRPLSPQMMVKTSVALPSAALEKRFVDTILSCFDASRFEQVSTFSAAGDLYRGVKSHKGFKYVVEDLLFALRKDPTHLKGFTDALKRANPRPDLAKVCDDIVANGLRPVPSDGPAPASLGSLPLSTSQRKALGGLVDFMRVAFGDQDARSIVRELSPQALVAVPMQGTAVQIWDRLAAYVAQHPADRDALLKILVRDRPGRAKEVAAVVDAFKNAGM